MTNQPQTDADRMRELEAATSNMNVNKEYAADRLAALVRSLIRGSIAQQPGGPAMDAQRALLEAVRVLRQLTQEDIRGAFWDATQLLAPERGSAVDAEWKHLAAEGARYYVDMTSTDGYSQARESKSQQRLIEAARAAMAPKVPSRGN